MPSHAPGLTAPHTTVLACQEQVGFHALKEVHRFEHVRRVKRDSCYVATVVLDLCAVLGMRELYGDAQNDFLAVGARPTALELPDVRGQFAVNGEELVFHPDVRYRPELSGDEPVAAHHVAADRYKLLQEGRAWDLLAVSAVARDRHWPAAITQLWSGLRTTSMSNRTNRESN